MLPIGVPIRSFEGMRLRSHYMKMLCNHLQGIHLRSSEGHTLVPVLDYDTLVRPDPPILK